MYYSQFCSCISIIEKMKFKTTYFFFFLFTASFCSYGQISNQVPQYIEFQANENAGSCDINILTSKFYFENKETKSQESKYSLSTNIYKGLVSPGIQLQKQYKYEISFSYKTIGKLPASRYYVFLESNDNYRYINLNKSTVVKNSDNTETRTLVISVDQSDVYYIGLCTYKDCGFNNICLYDFLIDWFYADNGQACSIKNADRP